MRKQPYAGLDPVTVYPTHSGVGPRVTLRFLFVILEKFSCEIEKSRGNSYCLYSLRRHVTVRLRIASKLVLLRDEYSNCPPVRPPPPLSPPLQPRSLLIKTRPPSPSKLRPPLTVIRLTGFT